MMRRCAGNLSLKAIQCRTCQSRRLDDMVFGRLYKVGQGWCDRNGALTSCDNALIVCRCQHSAAHDHAPSRWYTKSQIFSINMTFTTVRTVIYCTDVTVRYGTVRYGTSIWTPTMACCIIVGLACYIYICNTDWKCAPKLISHHHMTVNWNTTSLPRHLPTLPKAGGSCWFRESLNELTIYILDHRDTYMH